jgi:hypothetical protein
MLAYMALRARDQDSAPWYGAGHEELAVIALGLPMGSGKQRDHGYRIVRRAMTALHRAGVVETAARAVPGRHARYRLWLNGPTLDHGTQVTERPVNNHPESHERRSLSDRRPTENVGHSVTGEHQFVGHSASERRSLSDLQRSKEEEEVQVQERKDPEENLRNGELWKTAPPGAAEPPGQIAQNGHKPSAIERAAKRAADRRRLDQSQEPA